MRFMLTVCLLVAVSCKPQQRFNQQPQAAAQNVDYDYDNVEEPYGLSSGAFELFGNIQSSFSCEGRIYGYYADEELNCQIFHVCEPVAYPDGRQETIQHNFFCPNQTVFDQSILVCNHAVDAIPCQESSQFHFRNEEFGIIPPKNDY